MDEKITGKTRLTGLLGCPVEHTVSPQLHNTLSSMLGINAVYIPLRVERDRLEDAVKGLRACGFTGFNVTIPFKSEILDYVDGYDDEVRLIGAANTIVNDSGRLKAYNTDAEGFARSFEGETGTSFKGKRVVLLGAGGSARALAVKTALKGADKLLILNRTVERARDIAGLINREVADIALAGPLGPEGEGLVGGYDIVINTTSLGLHPNTGESPLIEADSLQRGQIVFDAIYNPPRTRFLQQAEGRGCKTLNGMGMLFYQGVLAYELWMGLKIKKEILDSLLSEFLKYLVK